MKLKKLFLLIATLVLGLTIVACTKKDPTPNPQPQPQTQSIAIKTVLETKINNDEIQIEGVVYSVISNGFFVADSAEGAIFVVMSSTWDKNVAVGDKVKVKGQFSYSSNFPQVKNVANVEKVSSNNTQVVTATQVTVPQINELNTKAKVGSYHKLVTVTGTVTKDATNMYSLMDDEGEKVYFDNNSDKEVLANYENKRVTLTAVTFKYLQADATWSLAFAGSANITETPLTFADVKAKAMAYLDANVAKNVYGVIVLPTTHPLMPAVTFNWDVEANSYISITNNEATITTDSADHEVTLKVTISDGETLEVVDFKVVLKGITKQTVAEFIQNIPTVDMSKVIVEGIVVSVARNQSETQRSVILMDPTTKQTVPVDFGKDENYITNTSETYKAIKQGDKLVVTGQYRLADRTTILNVTNVETISTGNEFVHDFENAFVLNSFENYTELANNTDRFSGQLVKFDNPFINFSTSSAPAVTNWVRLGYNEEAADAGHGTEKRKFAFLIAAQNENLGSDEWYKSLDIPFINKGAKQFDLEIYAYSLYVSDSYVAFIIPDASCYKVADDAQVEIDIKSTIPGSIESGTISLLKTHEIVGAITWTSSNTAVINPETGVVGEVSENTEVTLTASYTLKGEVVTLEIKVTVLSSQAMSVSQVLASATNEAVVKLEGVVVGFAADGNNVESRKGIIVKDLATNDLILVNGIGSLYNCEYPNYVVEENKTITVGSKVVITGKYLTDTAAIGSGPAQTGRKNVDLAEGGKVVVTETATISWNQDDMIVVDSNEACADLLADLTAVPYGQIIKFVGTEDAPIYVGGSSNSSPMNVKVFMTNAVDNNGTKYNGKILSLKTDVNEANAGEAWHQKYLALPEAFICPNTTNAARKIVGTMYAVISYLTGTYAQMAIVNLENWEVLPEAEYVAETVVAGLPETAEVGELKFALPTTTYLTGAITWTSSSAVINLETMTAAEVEENTEVTLTATFTYKGETLTATHTITVNAPILEAPKTVTEVIAMTEEAPVRVEGVVIGFASDGNNDESRKGIILMDNATQKIVLLNNIADGAYPVYKDVNGTEIKIGDKLIVAGNYKLNTAAISSGPEQIGRKNIEVTKINIVESNVELNFNDENALVIDSNDDMIALFSDKTQIFGKVIKLVGTAENPICLGGSSSKLPVNFKIFFNKDATENADTKYNGQTLSLKSDTAAANTGSATWYTDLFGFDGPFVGPKDDILPIEFTGTLYIVITHNTSTYYQANIVNYSACSVTKIN